MNQKIILIGTILAVTAISIPMIITEISPKPDIWDDDSWSTGNWTSDDIEEFPGVWCHQECKSLIGKDGEVIRKDCRTVCSFWGTNFTFE